MKLKTHPKSNILEIKSIGARAQLSEILSVFSIPWVITNLQHWRWLVLCIDVKRQNLPDGDNDYQPNLDTISELLSQMLFCLEEALFGHGFRAFRANFLGSFSVNTWTNIVDIRDMADRCTKSRFLWLWSWTEQKADVLTFEECGWFAAPVQVLWLWHPEKTS